MQRLVRHLVRVRRDTVDTEAVMYYVRKTAGRVKRITTQAGSLAGRARQRMACIRDRGCVGAWEYEYWSDTCKDEYTCSMVMADTDRHAPAWDWPGPASPYVAVIRTSQQQRGCTSPYSETHNPQSTGGPQAKATTTYVQELE